MKLILKDGTERELTDMEELVLDMALVSFNGAKEDISYYDEETRQTIYAAYESLRSLVPYRCTGKHIPERLRVPKGMVRMSFVFSEEKSQALGYSAQACYEVVDELFARYGISPIEQGVYQAPDDQNSFTAFGVAHKLPYSDWFLKVIEAWTCADEDSIPEDCLALHYEYAAQNQ